MSSLNEMLNFEYDLSQNIFCKGDLLKRRYVYFYYRNQKTGKLKRLAPIYGTVNTPKTKEARLSILVAYRKSLLKFLKQGYNSYMDNSDLYNNKKDVLKRSSHLLTSFSSKYLRLSFAYLRCDRTNYSYIDKCDRIHVTEPYLLSRNLIDSCKITFVRESFSFFMAISKSGIA